MAETSVLDAIPLKSSGDCPSCATRDLISDLPDALIRHVFSFLPLRDVVRTSVLSKRWRSTWTTTTDIVFNGFLFFYRSVGNRPRSTLEMSSILESILSRYASATVKKFHVTGFVCETEASFSKVDLWLHFAVQHRVEYLRLWPDRSLAFLYKLPESLCCLSSLVCLEVGECGFPLGVTIRWPCLKVLWIHDVELSDDVLGQIFRGSPVLETLKLGRCWGLKNVIVDSSSLREFVLMGLNVHRRTVEKVCAPYLLCLRVSGLNQAEFRLDDVSSLVEAELDFFIDIFDGPYSECCGLLKELLKKLCRVPAITIGSWCLRMLSLLEMDRVPSPLSNCQNLILHAPVERLDLPGIVYMLRSSQRLEKLVIRLIHYPVFGFGGKFDKVFNFGEEEFLYLRKWDLECLEHLRRVEIIGFGDISWDSKPLFALIKFLLGDALVLEKLIIKAESPTLFAPEGIQAAVLSKLPSLIQSLLSYPRASTNAEVFFNYDLRKVPSGERMKIRFSG